MPVTATVRSAQDALRQEVAVSGGRHTIVVDEPESLGGTDAAPTPMELLAASMAGCVAITLRMYARRKGWELADLGVDVCLDREDRPQKVSVRLRLPDDLPPDRCERLRAIAQRCPVSRALELGFEVEHPAAA